MTKTTAYILTATAVTLWGAAGFFTKDLLEAGVEALEIAFWRLLLSGALFILHALWQKDLNVQRPKDLLHFAGFAVFVIGLHYVGFSAAIEAGGLSLVNIVLASVPAIILLAAWPLFRERLTFRTLALVSLGGLGLVLASLGSGQGIHVSFASLALSFLAAVTIAAYTLASKGLLRRYSPVTMNAFIMPLAAFALLPFVTFSPKPLHVWFDLALLTFLPSYLAHLFYQTGLKHIETSKAALLNNLEPVTGLLLAALFLSERFHALGVVGVVMVFAVALAAVLPRRTRQEPQPKPQPSLRPYRRELNVATLEPSRGEMEE